MSGRGHGAGPRLTETTSFTVIGLGRLLQRRLEEVMAEEGVTLRHLGALGHLRTGQGVSVTDLARRAGVAVQSMHATIDMLVARSAIDPGGETRRGRPARRSLTDEGHHLLAVASTARGGGAGPHRPRVPSAGGDGCAGRRDGRPRGRQRHRIEVSG
ncbi:MAG TPA: MarR family winged helix-turn-helix transcriptional regulator [Euzebyales bacterium]|nr:MarR family winged helix-turn-helix transcriptional regulator [Euzebyales bacterium]